LTNIPETPAVKSAAFCKDQVQDLAKAISQLSPDERAEIVRLLMESEASD
jgi:hypothetical protein